jgi:uncharacterized protein (DUF2126 family)
MIDGRHTGTGGGNHVVVGGATTMDSPFLRRPDLLRSLILLLAAASEPVLPVLGPVHRPHQPGAAHRRGAPRQPLRAGDRAGADPAPGDGAAPLPWLVDRLLRNLLIDVTGNTHRAEICIDKLYSPDGPTGRLGLVEFRGFEMPPDPRMSLAQQVLIRAIIARSGRRPAGQSRALGHALHDRFMLPHFLWRDLLDVLADLRAARVRLRPEWFEAQAEFRFPFCGEVSYEGVHLEIRQALEPWHVLGETGAIGGTVRYTDSSVERLQVKLSADDPAATPWPATAARAAAAVTETSGVSVGGVRFKAWQPAMALHPTLPVNAPLTFDIFDTGPGGRWAAASITWPIPAGATTTPSR